MAVPATSIALTKKGVAYVHRHNPTRCPAGIEPSVWRKAVSRRVQVHLALATALLGILDRLDGDFDLEDNGDHEPSLGAADRYINGRFESDLEFDDMDSEGDELDAREGDELDRGEADWGDYDSCELIEGGGSGKL